MVLRKLDKDFSAKFAKLIYREDNTKADNSCYLDLGIRNRSYRVI